MGRKLFYKPGSFYRVDDRTGFPERAEHTKKQWNNVYTREKSFEPRQPQDFVRGRKDDQTVPDARPLAPAVFLEDISFLAKTAPIRSRVITLTQPFAHIAAGDTIAIQTDDGNVFFVAVGFSGRGDFNTDFNIDFNLYGAGGYVLGLAKPLPRQSSAGSQVYNTDYVSVVPDAFPQSSGFGYP